MCSSRLTQFGTRGRKAIGTCPAFLADVRRAAGRKLLPDAALVVIDEAHNLKSTKSQIYQSLMSVLSGGFDALLFLTATPFQLGRYELRNIVDFFRHARTYEGREEAFGQRVAEMEAGMSAYIDALDQFGIAWRVLGKDEIQAARECAQGHRPTEGSSRPEQAGARFQRCLQAKAELEAGLKPFLVRSVRERDHDEHCGLTGGAVALTPESRIPLALVDRLITEMLSVRRRTFISSALTSACSSWDALFTASITQETGDGAFRTRDLLVDLRDRGLCGDHPKIDETVRVCREGLAAGEKTLVFVERAETGRSIRDAVSAHLGDYKDTNARARLQDPARFGWPSLRENYLHTLYPQVFGELPAVSTCLKFLNERYAQDLWRRVDVDGSSHNYKIEKRLIEHVLFRAATKGLKRRKDASAEELEAVSRILDPTYVMNGLDLSSGETGTTVQVSSQPRRAEPRELNSAFAEAYIQYASPWASSIDKLRRLSPDDRADLVDAAAAAIASSHLQRELAQVDAVGDPAEHFRAVADLLRAPAWRQRFEAIAAQAADLAAIGSDEAASDRVRRLANALRSNERVQFISGDTRWSTRQNAVDGFNTPLYPEVIVTTPVLAEGLDLHRQCRRVVHHDLPWNPAKLEQRTGRVDRIGSLSERLAATNEADTSIHVWLPYMHGTYDETIFDRVMARRREFHCVLGNKPEWEREELPSEEAGQPIDKRLVDALQVDLGPEYS